jgi:hypothetical protein
MIYEAAFKEKHGVRPHLRPGDMVKIGKHEGVVSEAETNIDGCSFSWNEKPISLTYGYDGMPEPVGYSHAWRPQYSVDWLSGNLHVAWWQLHEFDSFSRVPRKPMKPWPSLNLEETDNDCANARKKEPL